MAKFFKFSGPVNTTFITTKGIHVPFIGPFAYVEENDKETIEELMFEANRPESPIGYDEADGLVDEAVVKDPMHVYKERIRAEIMAELAAEQGRDVTGDAKADAKVKPASTADLIAQAKSVSGVSK